MKITLRLKTTPLSPSDRDIVQQHFHALFEFILQSSNFKLNPIVIEREPQPPNGNTLRFYHIVYFSLVDCQTNTRSDHALIGLRNTINQRELFIYF